MASFKTFALASFVFSALQGPGAAAAGFGADSIRCAENSDLYRERLEPIIANFETAAETCSRLYMSVDYWAAKRSVACKTTWDMWLDQDGFANSQVNALASQGCAWSANDWSEECVRTYVDVANLTDIYERYEKALARYQSARDIASEINSKETAHRLEEHAHARETAQALLDDEREKAFRIVQRFLRIDETGEGSAAMANAVRTWNRSQGISHDGLTLSLLMQSMKRFPPELFEMPVQKEADGQDGYPPAARHLDTREIKAVQEFLGVPADGKIGSKTMDAVWAWNQDMGIAHSYISEHMIDLALER